MVGFLVIKLIDFQKPVLPPASNTVTNNPPTTTSVVNTNNSLHATTKPTVAPSTPSATTTTSSSVLSSMTTSTPNPTINNNNSSLTNNSILPVVDTPISTPTTTNLPVTTQNTPSNTSTTNAIATLPIQSSIIPPSSQSAITRAPTLPATTITPATINPVVNKIPTLDPTFPDPLEDSLRSLEHDSMNALENIGTNPFPSLNNSVMQFPPMNNIPTTNSVLHRGLHNSIPDDLSSIIPPINPTGVPTSNMMHSSNNGFGGIKQDMELPLNNNGLMTGPSAMNLGAMASIFDPIPTPQVTQSQTPSINQIPNMHQSLRKDDKPLITPKPIEELTNPIHHQLLNTMDKKIDSKGNPVGNYGPGFKPKPDANIKNASSWCNIIQQANNSPQNPNLGGNNKQHTMQDSFQAFKNKARQKQDQQRALMEQQEQRRHQKEQAERIERMRQENEKQRVDDDKVMDKVRLVLNGLVRSYHEIISV